ncbi:MAG: flagellar motor switch protein FliN [Treponema sp.]|nr:flagellar motor switch protein FliN [Treponema sp.]
MSDGAISQDEIDALLSGVAIDGLNSSGHVGNGPSFQIDISTLLKFAEDLQPKLEENVNKFTGASFKIGTPIVEFSERDKVLSKLPEVVVTVSSDYSDSAKGNHIYLMSSEFALKLFALTNNEEAAEVDDMVLSVVSEIIATYISSQITILDATGKLPGLSYSTPESINESKAMIMFPQGEFALISYPVTLDSNAYTLWECIGGEPAEKISNALGGNKSKAEEPPALDAAMQPNMMDMQGNSMNAAQGGMQGMGMQNMQMNMGMPNMGMQNMQMNMGMPNMGQNMGMNVPNIQSLQFPNLQAGISSSEQGNIGLIMDVFMEMTVELGRTKKSIKDILGMGEGTIIELDKLAGEPVDILVNHKPIAKGEVVVIDENFGVRVTEILSPMERVSDIN